MKRFALATAALVLGLMWTARGLSSGLDYLALRALDPDSIQAGKAVEALRALGPAGLDAMLETHAELIKAGQQKTPAELAADAKLRRLSAAVDAIAGQRDALASRLYWHTDIERAKAAAHAAHKPILSLRLLGKLTDEFSCANSRFFRTTLYANAEVSAALRDKFILHWESVRPVPRVTINFGDGRKMECTLTGNSIHYVLDSQGRPVDALPGLYGPRAFLRGLETGGQIVALLVQTAPEARSKMLSVHHQFLWEQVSRRWQDDLDRIQAPAPATPQSQQTANAAPRAAQAALRAFGKSAAEVPLLHAMARPTAELIKTTDDATWNKLAALHADDARLDNGSIALIRKEQPRAADAGRLAITKSKVEDPLLRLVRNFESSLALDTIKNEYTLHRQIHEWFMKAAPSDVSVLNDRVYAELFLTPKTDPWLGLSPDGVYTALENSGVRNH